MVKKLQKQRQWKIEKTEIENLWNQAKKLKPALKAKGCDLPFYDFLDSYETEFNRLVAWAKETCPSLHGVFEISNGDFDSETDWGRLGLPADWMQVFFVCDDETATSYTARDSSANLRGAATGFHDPSGRFHTVIEVIKNPECKWEHKEYKYAFKLPILLHEIGHVRDYENKGHFNPELKTADLIEGEVYAHLFALDECFRRAYFTSGVMYLDSLMDYKDSSDYRGEVVRRLLSRFNKPEYKQWLDYDL